MQSYDITFCNNLSCTKYKSCLRNFTDMKLRMSKNQLVSIALFNTCIAENYKYYIKREN